MKRIYEIAKYCGRLFRMTDMLLRRSIDFANYRAALRPAQVAVLARSGGMVFCDDEAERCFFGQ